MVTFTTKRNWTWFCFYNCV